MEGFELEDFDSDTVTFGDTTFKIEKLMPMEAWRVFGKIRTSLASLATIPVLGGDNIALAIGIATGIPQDIFESIRRDLFAHVTFTSKSVPTPVKLITDEDGAFQDLEAYHVGEVMARCLYRNFIGSLDALQSRASPDKTSPPPELKISPRSSPTP